VFELTSLLPPEAFIAWGWRVPFLLSVIMLGIVLYVARREKIKDGDLVEAVRRAGRGLIDADLGGGIIKQRVARAGQGRSGDFRMLLAYRDGHRAVFLYGFAKNERENIADDELQTLREIGAAWLATDAQQIARAITENALQEALYGDEDAKP
jgi:hypothetical protein